MIKSIRNILLCLMIAGFALSATTGKISGRVTDENSGQPLSGVNIIVEGTTLGSFSDENGYYVILNVPPDDYRVKFSMIGYGTKIYEQVRTVIDLTTTLDIALSAEAIEMQAVVAIAKRPIIQKDVASSQMNVSSDVIENMPVKSISEVIGYQAGIEDGLTIRGSSSYQTGFIVDGFSYNDERSNVPYTSISLSSIKEVNIQTGGFNAEYDNVRSGVINVVTKEGDRKKYDGTISFQYAPPTSKHFGISSYDPMDYQGRSYNDDAVAWFGTYSESYTDVNLNGQYDMGEPFTDSDGNGIYYQTPWDDYTQDSYPKWRGFNTKAYEVNTDDDDSNDMTAAALQRLYQWQHRRQGDISIPDYNLDLGFGGPVPLLSRSLGNLRFFFSYRGTQTAYIVPLSRDAYTDGNATLKLTSDISNKTKLTISGMYGEVKSVSMASWTSLPTGDNNFYSVSSVADVASTNYVLFVPDVYNPTTIYRHNIGAKLTHQLSGNSFYELNVSQMGSYYYTDRQAARDTSKIYELWPGYFVDEGPYGFLEGGPGTVVDMRTDWVGFAKDRSKTNTTTAKADYTSQVNRYNQIKTGVSLIYTDYLVDAWNESSNKFWTYYNEWYQNPFRFGAYVQDKIEFEGLIVNLGLRFDYSDANASWYDLSSYDDLLNSNSGFDLETIAPKTESKGIYKLSPRLGISHPISENAKLYFNYGHFNALPQSRYRFVIDRLGTGAVHRLGDPELSYSTTIAYELGFERNLFNTYLFKVAGYYKDISDQPSWTLYTSADGDVSYYQATSNSYQDIRGAELTLTKNAGRWFTGLINYTYQVSTSGYFGVARVFEDPALQRQYLKENVYQERPRPQPYARMSLELHSPRDFTFMGLPKLFTANWNANLLSRWKSGAYSTYTSNNTTTVVDNVQWVDYFNTDLRVSKAVDMGQWDLVFYCDVANLFNIKRLSYAGMSDTYDTYDYLESLHFSDEFNGQKGTDKIGDYRTEGVDFRPAFDVESLAAIGDPNTTYLYYSQADEKYFIYSDGEWVSEGNKKVDQLLEDKAYINMPNIESLTFLNPCMITLGLKINF